MYLLALHSCIRASVQAFSIVAWFPKLYNWIVQLRIVAFLLNEPYYISGLLSQAPDFTLFQKGAVLHMT